MRRPGIIIAILVMAAIANADTIDISRLASDTLDSWQQKSFRGETAYRIVTEAGTPVIEARSSAAASGIYRKVKLDPTTYRYLRWRWKVAAPLSIQNEKNKPGDDYAARVYVIFPGFFFWQSKAINYVWGSRLVKGEVFPSPYTGNVAVIAVETGSELAGKWVPEQRDILADYRRAFGSEPRKIGAIAIMTDTDNTGQSATAWYGDISLSDAP